MMARSDGSVPRAGFSTVVVMRTTSSPSTPPSVATTPYLPISSGGKRIRPTTDASRCSAAAIIRARASEPSAMRSSGSSTAKGSSPTWRGAHAHGVAEAAGLALADVVDVGQLGQRPHPLDLVVLARRGQRRLQLGARSKWSSMAFLDRPVTMRMSVMPAATASSTTYWMPGLSTRGIISLGMAFVAGRKRVPSPAAGMTALRICTVTSLRLAAQACLSRPDPLPLALSINEC